MDLVQHSVLCKEQCLCFYMTCPEFGISFDWVSVVLERVLRHMKSVWSPCYNGSTQQA